MTAVELVRMAESAGLVRNDCVQLCLSKEEIAAIAEQVLSSQGRKSLLARVWSWLKSLWERKGKDILTEFAVALVVAALKKAITK